VLKRIIEFSNPGSSLTITRGLLCVKLSTGEGGGDSHKIPVDDIGAIVFSNSHFTISGSVLSRLAKKGVISCICDERYQPSAYLLPVSVHHESGARVEMQANLDGRIKAALWKEVVKAKILNQAKALRCIGVDSKRMARLSQMVEPGDPKNIEAQAARLYWKLLFGNNFKRDFNAKDMNQFLNYGYAILRTCVTRSIIVHGLSPGLGLHHSNSRNPFKLADDLIEPFRPFIDVAVYELADGVSDDLSSEAKACLVNVMYKDFDFKGKQTNLWNGIARLLDSFVSVLSDNARKLEFPVFSEFLSTSTHECAI